MRRFMFLVLAGTLFVGAFTGCSSVVHRTPDLDNITLHFQYATGMLNVSGYDQMDRLAIRVDDGTYFSVDNSTRITRLDRDGVEWNVPLTDLAAYNGKRGSVSGYFIKKDPYRLATDLIIDDMANAPPPRID